MQNNYKSPQLLLTIKEFQSSVPINLRWAIQKNYTEMVEWKVLVRYGRKLLIDPDRFWDWLRSRGWQWQWLARRIGDSPMSDRGATGFSNQALLDQLLAGPYAHFTKVGEDDYRGCSERNPSFSLSSNGYYDHKAGKGGIRSELARDESRYVSHRDAHQYH